MLPEAEQAIEDDAPRRIIVNVDRMGKYKVMGVRHELRGVTVRIRSSTALNQNVKVLIRADQRTPYKNVMDLFGTLAQEGIRGVSIAAQRR